MRGPPAKAVLALLDAVRGRDLPIDALGPRAAELAALLLTEARRRESLQEGRRRRTLARMVEDPAGKAFAAALADRAGRSRDPRRAAKALESSLEAHGTPRFVSAAGRIALGLYRPGLPAGLVTRGIERELRRQTRSFILDARPRPLRAYLAQRARQGARVNLNLLGEAVVGEREAAERLDTYLRLARDPAVEALSVKLSSLDSQIESYAPEAAVARLTPRLLRICQAARGRTRSGRPRRVHLDMEAYDELGLSFELFARLLEAPSTAEVELGVALQAYVPESLALLDPLLALARARHARGGAATRLRLVKGANLSMEAITSAEASLPSPLRPDKASVDAAFKAMLERVARPEEGRSLYLGVASHNLFDLSLALLLRSTRGLEASVELEMLEGMAGAVGEAVMAAGAPLLLYAPIVEPASFHAAVAYLVRRLEEGTAPENFLAAGFGMRPASPAFEREQAKFEEALGQLHRVDARSRRAARPAPPALEAPFDNEPNSDFTQAEAREALRVAIHAECAAPTPAPTPVGPRALDALLARAVAEAPHLAASSGESREALLAEVARALRARRAQLVALMVAEGAKRAAEADAEVSEAVDFAEYYLRAHRALRQDARLRAHPRGVALVAPPWNFPLAIPAGGSLAALVTGNPVLLKPAPETPRVAQAFVQLCHEAGVPPAALQLVIATDEDAGALVRDARVASVLLTGATATAKALLASRPRLHLLAETGGKNASIISAAADRDEALRHVLRSAFSHAGQKCSATSLLILEAELYDDPAFLARLADAATSLPVGLAEDPTSFVTPLIREPEGALARALAQLDEGERWLVPPRRDPAHPRLWGPAIKLGVRRGSFTHQRELFGPVLGVMRAQDLDEAIALANDTPYGLCAGLHSLDPDEQRRFAETMYAGNLYINRGTTGAIVHRQPFGGLAASSFGPGAKTGGPHLLPALCELEDAEPVSVMHDERPRDLEKGPRRLLEALDAHVDVVGRRRLEACAEGYEAAYQSRYGRVHELAGLPGQQNLYRYLPRAGLALYGDCAPEALGRMVLASLTLTGRAHVILSANAAAPWLEPLGARVQLERLGPEALADALRTGRVACLRAAEPLDDALYEAAAVSGAFLDASPPLVAPDAELPRYLSEQAVSVSAHRFGLPTPPLSIAGLGRD